MRSRLCNESHQLEISTARKPTQDSQAPHLDAHKMPLQHHDTLKFFMHILLPSLCSYSPHCPTSSETHLVLLLSDHNIRVLVHNRDLVLASPHLTSSETHLVLLLGHHDIRVKVHDRDLALAAGLLGTTQGTLCLLLGEGDL